MVMKVNLFLSRIAFLCNVLFFFCLFRSMELANSLSQSLNFTINTMGIIAPLLNFIVNLTTLFLLF